MGQPRFDLKYGESVFNQHFSGEGLLVHAHGVEVDSIGKAGGFKVKVVDSEISVDGFAEYDASHHVAYFDLGISSFGRIEADGGVCIGGVGEVL